MSPAIAPANGAYRCGLFLNPSSLAFRPTPATHIKHPQLLRFCSLVASPRRDSMRRRS